MDIAAKMARSINFIDKLRKFLIVEFMNDKRITVADLLNKRVGVLGIGVEGRATIDYLRSLGIADIEALDRNRVDGIPDGISTVFGEGYMENLERFSVVFRSPGFRPDLPQLVEAVQKGTQITSAISFFLCNCPAPVIGITGTVGKGTTSSMVAAALESSGFTVHLGGNIGQSPLVFLSEVQPDHRVVLEISSFQAMDVTASPQYAGILKTTSEHLDWHRNTEEYRVAKAHLLHFQTALDTVVYHADSLGAQQIARSSAGCAFGYSLEKELENGVFIRNEKMVFSSTEGEQILPIDIKAVRLAGRFNLENIAAAVLLSHLAGGHWDNVCKAAQVFEGLPNRLSLSATGGNVRFYNDSYATRPDAAMAAIDAFEEPMALVMGGSEKNADFSQLFDLMQSKRNIVSLSLIGATAKRMSEEICQTKTPPFSVTISDSLEAAMTNSVSSLGAKGVVLMAPACASFGMFKNYKDRGEQFVQLAQKISSQL